MWLWSYLAYIFMQTITESFRKNYTGNIVKKDIQKLLYNKSELHLYFTHLTQMSYKINDRPKIVKILEGIMRECLLATLNYSLKHQLS